MMAKYARLSLVALFLIAPVALAACDSGGSATATPGAAGGSAGGVVQDLNSILASGLQFQDLQANSVTVFIDTSIPVVCAAAYGPTTDYGSLSTDPEMAGQARTDHHALLSGLQPDTDYHLRMQAVGPDGIFYRSNDYTFHTPDAAPGAAKPAGTNLALLSNGAHVTGVSSNFGGGDNSGNFGADSAFDGDPNTQWSSNGDGDKAWIEIELAGQAHITSIGFWTRTMGSSAQIMSFQVVADGGETDGPFQLGDAGSIHYFPVDFTAQRLRFEAVDTSGGNTGAVEIEVYGQP